MNSHHDSAELFELYLDDRDALSEQQYAALWDILRNDPMAVAKLKDQLILDEKLAQLMAVDRADFPAQVAQRIRDLDLNSDDLARQVEEMRELAQEDSLRQSRVTRRNWTGWVLAGCLLLAAGVGSFYVVPGLNDRPRAVRVYGAVTLIRENVKSPLLAGEQLRYGDRVLTRPQAYAVLQFPDGTRVSVADQTLLRVSSRYRSGKVLDVDRGAVAADVSAQPASRPMRFLTPRADAKVVGTELMLEVNGERTRLNVAHGQVELRGLTSVEGVLVEQNQFAVSTGGRAEVETMTWPASRERLEVMLQPGGERPPPTWQLRGKTSWERGIQFQRGSAVLPAADAQAVTRGCRAANQLTVELVFRFESTQLTGPARIVSLSSDAFTRNFTVGQEGGFLIFRLRTPETGENGTNPEVRLCRIGDRQWHHVAITYQPGKLACFLDGEQVSQSDQVQGDFSNWTDHYLTLGDEWSGERDHSWRGEIAALAVYSRALGPTEVMRNMTAMAGR